MTAAAAREGSAPRGALLAIVLLAAAVRVGILFLSGGQGEMQGLAWRYQSAARALAAGYGLVRPADDAPPEVDLPRLADSLAARGERLTPRNAPRITPARWRPMSDHPPGYPVFLFLIDRGLGPRVIAWAQAIQIAADSLASLLVFAIARRLAGRRAALLAALGYAVFPPIAYLATSQVADAWSSTLFVLAFWLFLRLLDARSTVSGAVCGAGFGVLCLMRPDFLLAPVLFAATAFVVEPRRARLLVPLVAMLVAFGLVLAPWTLRNQRVQARLSPGTTAAGMMLLQGIGQFPNPHGVGMPDGWYADEAHRHGFEGQYDPGADRMFRDRYLEIARGDPKLIVTDLVRRTAISLAPPYHWGYVNPAYEGHSFYDYVQKEQLSPRAALQRHPGEILAAYWDRFLFVPISLALLLASVLVLVLGRRDPRTVVWILAPWVYVVAVHLPVFLTTRLLVPGVFAQLVALAWCVDRLRARGAAAPGTARSGG